MNGERSIPLTLLFGVPLLFVGLGSQLWGLAMVGALLVAIWIFRRYPPRQS